MSKYVALFAAFWLLGALHLAAQTPANPVTYGVLPADWKGAIDVTEDNNGIFKIGFARVLKGDSGFGFIYEGASITVEQSQKTLAEWKKEMYGHMNNTGREDSQEKCRCTRLGDGNTKIAGYNAYFIGELQRCYKKADGRFDDEDLIRVYYVQVGKAAYYIYTESDSEKEGGTAEYEREIDQILASLRFFGSTGGGGSNNNTDKPNPQPNTNTENNGGSDEDISIGDVVIGAVVGGGVAGLAGWIIKSLVTKGKTAAAANAAANQANKPNPSKNNPQPPKDNSGKKPATTKPKRKEDEAEKEPEKEEDEDEEKKENTRYVLQISQNNLELAVNQTAQIRVAVWQIDSQGAQTLALDAPIQAQSNSAALWIAPTTGEGAIMLDIELRHQPDTEILTIDVSAKAGSQAMRGQIKIKVKKNTDTYEFITAQVPPDKQELIANGHDVCYYYVQVRNSQNDKDTEIARLNANIRISNAGGDAGWLNLGEQKMIDGWQAVGFTASNPQAHLVHQSQVVHPPRQVSLLATVELPDGKILQKIFDFPLQQPAVLDVDNDSIYFPALPISIDSRHQKHIDITAFIDAPVSGEKWTFEASYEAGKPKLTAIGIIPKNDSQATIQLKTPTHSLIEGQASEFWAADYQRKIR
jgi:hypothetical protein